MPFSTSEKLACLERELRMRHRVYPGLVRGRRMDASQATKEIALMTEIVAEYRAKVEPDMFVKA